MTKKKVLVTTLECGEADFQRCVDAIKAQKNVILVHQVISSFSEKEAHEKLIESWNAQLKAFNAFVKIDADTVLRHDTIIEKTVDLMLLHEAAATQSPLHDFFTDGPINGLNCYAPSKNTFGNAVNELYCDRSITHNAIVLYGKNMSEDINPAGDHCKYCNEFQAFHFGVHRGMKSQENTMRLVKRAYEKLGDIRRAMALEGFRLASEFKTNKLGFNYRDKDLIERYESSLNMLRQADDSTQV